MLEERECSEGHAQARPKGLPKTAKCLFGPCGCRLKPTSQPTRAPAVRKPKPGVIPRG